MQRPCGSLPQSHLPAGLDLLGLSATVQTSKASVMGIQPLALASMKENLEQEIDQSKGHLPVTLVRVNSAS